ncbi:hypothetical protein [Glycomyces arizonensis]|uniref:hypothetical protein n=1 Tax=Glycomyces arizonensis TaxID=256035 RepID=UPI0004106CCE|nr:hypothetical protein [Glycomyces arizonensis]
MSSYIASSSTQAVSPVLRLSVTILVVLALVGLVVYGVRRWRKARREGTVRGALKQVVGVLVLCPIGAELLLAYDETTGDPAAVAFAVVFFAGLYGAPALLARELARRSGWGWPSLLLLFAALGTAQACLIDQSMFSVDYQAYEGWEATREATLIPGLGISALNAFTFVGGHVIFSFAAPVAVAEAWSPRRAEASWLGPIGIAVTACAYAATAAMIIADPESRSAGTAQLVVSGAIVAGFIAAAALVGRWRRGAATGARRLPVLPSVAMAVIAAAVPDFLGQGWTALTAHLALNAALGVAIAVTIRRSGWSPWHSAAVATACLAVRGLMAFTYFPLAGDVEPGPKYAHNVVMLAVVVAAGALAWRRGTGAGADTATAEGEPATLPDERKATPGAPVT